MRLDFLSTPPSFSVMVTCRYHPVPPIWQASSRGSPHRHDAPSGSLFSPSSSGQLHDGGVKKTKETKKRHAITHAITPAITRLSRDNPRDNPPR